MNIAARLIACFAIWSVAACSSVQPKRVDSVTNDIATLRVVSVIEQPVLGIQYNRANYVANGYILFGVAGALAASVAESSVNADRRSVASKKMAPFHSALADTSTNQMLIDSLKAASSSIAWAKTVFESREKFTKNDRAKLILKMEEDALLVLSTSYSLTPEMESLEVTTSVAIYKDIYESKRVSNEKALLKRMNPIYRGGLKFQSKLYSGRYLSATDDSQEKKRQAIVAKYDGERFSKNATNSRYAKSQKEKELKALKDNVFASAEGDIDTEGTVWLEKDAALLKSTIQLAVSETEKMLTLDLNPSIASSEYRKSKENFNVGNMTGGKKTRLVNSKAKGWLIEKTNSRERIRLEDGFIYSVAEGDFIRPSVGNRLPRH